MSAMLSDADCQDLGWVRGTLPFVEHRNDGRTRPNCCRSRRQFGFLLAAVRSATRPIRVDARGDRARTGMTTLAKSGAHGQGTAKNIAIFFDSLIIPISRVLKSISQKARHLRVVVHLTGRRSGKDNSRMHRVPPECDSH
jgi:hypothetical protein